MQDGYSYDDEWATTERAHDEQEKREGGEKRGERGRERGREMQHTFEPFGRCGSGGAEQGERANKLAEIDIAASVHVEEVKEGLDECKLPLLAHIHVI
jgi:hypothetical protein